MKKIAIILPVFGLLLAGVASAHVTVSPKEVGVGKFQTFSISVPSEKEIATVGLRLVLPPGVEHVSPTVKPGWTIKTVSQDNVVSEDGHEAITEIIWTGGSIPGEYRDDFTFSVKVPSKEGVLAWKAYQTYKDGSVVEWDLGPGEQQPKNTDGSSNYSTKGPYSETKIINDLAPAKQNQNSGMAKSKYMGDSMILSILSVLISVFALYLAYRK
ncbi:MAG: YcnI family protein [Candidatus Doudnabacteria bacterium]|nr:YcnI family protein [Candidatus Doudnabacteria bacterium]